MADVRRPADTKFVVAVVLNWNGGEDTQRCIESLLAQDYPALTVVLIDNGSYDRTLEDVRRRFPQVRTIQLSENLGYVGGNNCGMRIGLEMGADYVFLVNTDVTLHTFALQRLVAAARPDTAALGPTVFEMLQPATIQSAGCMFDFRRGTAQVLNDIPAVQSREVDYVIGCGILISRHAIKAVGLFDDRFFAYAEELDWCLRAKEKGYRVLQVPSSRIWHQGHGVSPSAFQQFLLARNNLWVISRHCHGIDRITATIYFILVMTAQRSLSSLKRGDREAAFGALQGILWHVGLFATHNPLTCVRAKRPAQVGVPTAAERRAR
jgi:hypothetical protein